MNDTERAVLRFEADHPEALSSHRKQMAIRERFGFSATTYTSHLIHALADAESDTYAPEVVEAHASRAHRLRQTREMLGRSSVRGALARPDLPEQVHF